MRQKEFCRSLNFHNEQIVLRSELKTEKKESGLSLSQGMPQGRGKKEVGLSGHQLVALDVGWIE
ncbi:MAG: hypothetical protein LBE38_08365 [Deltaproteobacteria bacterium]|nr:hypothetical protein [Deltaproteobacteria bacterium]